jgi:putative component of toxin-antitoxin plasmid stabilization module
MIELRGYIDDKGNKPFDKWFADLDHNAAARVTTALTRIELGNFSNVKGVGAGVFECRIDFGPRIPGLFREGWRPACNPCRRGIEETPVQGHYRRSGTLGRLQTTQETGEVINAANP